MKPYLAYLGKLLRHIKYVRKACFRNGLYAQGLSHDLSKFRPSEFVPYARFFYGNNPRDKTGFYDASNTGSDAFDLAWLLHQKRNPHHWQFWVLPLDDGGTKVLKMPLKYAKEMLCDWWGASMAYGNQGNCRQWYEANKEKMQLHPDTRAWVEANIADGPAKYDKQP